MKHPSGIDLEAYAAGDDLAAVATHVEGCTECAAFVAKVRVFAREHRPAPDAAARAVRSAARRTTPRDRARWIRIATTAAVPLAAAAALLFYLRSPGDALPGATPARSSGDFASPSAPNPGIPEPETTFKGGVQLAVIRERAGQQERFTGSVRVRPGDRIRLEVALDREQAILGAVLGTDGSYVELMADAVRGAGTHFSERSAKIDASPANGVVLVGSADAIARARSSKDTGELAALRVEWGAAP